MLLLKQAILISCAFLVISCGFEDKGPVTEIQKLPSPNGKYILYEWVRESSMAFGSPISSMQILEAGQSFDPDEDDRMQLPRQGSFALGWVGDDTLKLITDEQLIAYNGNSPQPQSTKPHKVDVFKQGAVTIINFYYRFNAYGRGRDIAFNSFSATRDSIYIYKSHQLVRAGLKGEIIIHQAKGEVTGIEMYQVETGQDFIYLDSTGHQHSNQPRVSATFYRLVPDKPALVQSLLAAGVNLIEEQALPQ